MEYTEEMQTEGGDPIKGGTSTTVDKTPLYTSNNAYLQKRKDVYNKRLTEYVMDAFQVGQSMPKINGKPIESLDQIPTLIDKYGQQFYEQAKSINSNPEISDDQAKLLLVRQKKVDDAFGYIAQANKIVYEDLKNAAVNMDAKMKVNGWHSLLLNENGQFKAPDQARKDIEAFKQKQIADAMNAWRKANPIPQNAPQYWQRTDMPNPTGGRVVIVDGKPVVLDTRPKLANSQEGHFMLESMRMQNLQNQYKNLNYDDAVKRVLQEYNKNPKTRKIKAAEEGVFKQNAGGAKATMQTSEFRFDVDNYVDEDERGNVKVKPEMEYTVDLLKSIADNKNVLFAQGPVGENTVIPSGSDGSAMKMTKAILQDLQEEILNANRQKGSAKRTAGSISFVPIAGGDENYHAYYIKMNSAYFEKHTGTKEAPGIARKQKFVNDGITVFVPVAESEKTKIGSQSLKGTRISPVEGMINLSADGSFTRTIDDGMEYRITLDKKTNQYVVTGNAVAYNASTGKMDTVDINSLGVKSRYDMSVDLDEVEKTLFKLGLKNFEINRQRKREHSKLQGVRDPKQLSGN